MNKIDCSLCRKTKKARGKNEQLGLRNSFLQKILTGDIFLLTLAANMLGKNLFPKGCMKWLHDLILESICETNSMIIFLRAERIGTLTSCLTWLPLLALLLWTKLF